MISYSIIIPVYNRPVEVRELLESLLHQTCKDFEYIVVDGASQDQSVEVIHAHESCISKWISEPDTGIYNAMNKGVKWPPGNIAYSLIRGRIIQAHDRGRNLPPKF